jgi:16S rRNA (guanine527-N7)-methyltransferase
MQPLNFAAFERFNVSRESYEKLAVMVALLLDWQKRINLISPATIPDIWTRHVIDSVQLLPLIPVGVTSIADLGSGAGFPGLVLAATQPATVHMYESNGKKAAFLSEALRQMKCAGVVHRDRLEPFQAPPNMPQVQVITARAFAPLPLLLSLAHPFINQGATALFHKGQDVDMELEESAKSWRIVYKKHPSEIDSLSVIVEVKELARVPS